ncbi:MAG: hypothetical protein BWY57_02886 [Betaproteobacteria bacterium ADurb.Bin341]|nr:MAG: hypothetical protein BWY57_02886 [Betaproteobacteria bacterium ADurb.Bin341]
MMASVPPGVQMPPLPVPENLDEDFSRARTNVLEIYDADNDKMTGAIETVAWAKVDLDALVEQGWKPDAILRELARNHNEEAHLRSNVSTVLKKMVEEEKLSKAELMQELLQVNTELAERGLPEITLEELDVEDE